MNRIALSAAVVLALSACAAPADPEPLTPEPVVSEAPGQSTPPEPVAESIVPDLQVVEVASGQEVSLRQAVGSEGPVLLWAWAPHCPSCRAEAPGVEKFAVANADALKVIGLGTQDDLALAKGFLADTGVSTPQMLWDPSFQSWRKLGVTSQPTWILVSGDGVLLGRWSGGLPEQAILDLVA